MAKVILEENEKEVIGAAYKHFKKEYKHINPSVITEEEKKEVITEGLKHFKTSERLYKLALKLEKRAKQNQSILETAKKVNALGNKFEYIEDLYAVGRKEEAKTQYKDLCNKYLELLNLLKKEEVKVALKAVGSLALTVASMTIPFMAMSKFFPQLSLNAMENAGLSTIEKTHVKTLNKAKLYLKRAGAFTLCGLPVKAASKALNVGFDNNELKVLKSVDRMLKDAEREHSIYDNIIGEPDMHLS